MRWYAVRAMATESRFQFSAAWCIELSLRLVLGGFFLLSGWAKVQNPLLFSQDIANYQILSPKLSTILALVLPWLEIFAALGVIFRKLFWGSLSMLAAMLGVFILALSSAWLRGLDINCGCFGSQAESTSYGPHILMNLVLLACSAAITILYCRRAGLNGEGRPSGRPSTV